MTTIGRQNLFSVALVSILLTSACGQDRLVHLFAPGSLPGEYGVAALERSFRVRVDESVTAQIYLPTDTEESLASGPFPLVVFVAGALVAPEQYAWMATHIASRGHLVVMAEHFADLAIFSTGNSADVVEAVDRASSREGDLLHGLVDPTPAFAMGHSLGGVIATKTWLDRPERFSHLALIQSRPDPADAGRLSEVTFSAGEVFAIAGSRDERIPPELVEEELALFNGEVPLAIVEGQNHFQLVDGSTIGQAAMDGAATIEDALSRERLLAMLDLLLRFYDDPEAIDVTDHAVWPSGIITFDEYQEAL